MSIGSFMVTYYWSATNLATETSLEPDGWGDEWVSDSPNETIMRQRIASFHNIPVEHVSCYVYLQKQ